MNSAICGFLRSQIKLIAPAPTEPRKPTPKEDWFEHLQRIRVEREAAGYPFMNEEETTAHIGWLREGDRIDDLLQEADQQRQKPEQPEW